MKGTSNLMMRFAPALFIVGVASGQAVDFTHKTVVPPGTSPSLTISVNENLKALTLDLRGSRGTHIKRKFGKVANGATKVVSWRPKGNQAEQFAGTLRVHAAGGAVENLPIEFEAKVLEPLRVDVRKEKVDLERGTMTLKMTSEAGRVELKIRGEGKRVLYDDTIMFHGEPPGTPLTVSWGALPGKIVRIDFRVYDKWEENVGMALITWYAMIPHTEVNFRLDSAEIDPEERSKLDKSHAKIIQAIEDAKKDLDKAMMSQLKLFIAGHTDTLASHSYNQKLSNARARAIAKYFGERGTPIPVLAHGFGETRLFVQTPDSTEEPRNRRVEYILAVETPPMYGAVGWQRVR